MDLTDRFRTVLHTVYGYRWIETGYGDGDGDIKKKML